MSNMTFSAVPVPPAPVRIVWMYVCFSFSFLPGPHSPASGWCNLGALRSLTVVSSAYLCSFTTPAA